jgi:hypothetical protein
MNELFELLRSPQAVGDALPAPTVMFSLFSAALLSLPIALIYMKTHGKQGYCRNTVQTLILLGIIAAATMLIIDNNLTRAFGLVGAISIIRFRTKVKDPKDTAFIFLTIAIGMACGLRLYYISLLTTIFTVIVILLLWRLDFGKKVKKPKKA